MGWVKAALRAIPEAQEPDSNSRILMQSKLFWLSDIQTKLDEIRQLEQLVGSGSTGGGEKAARRQQMAAAQQQRYRKESDGPCTLLYRSEKLGWLPVLAVEHYPTVCRNTIRDTEETVWLSRRISNRQEDDRAVVLSPVQKGRCFGRYMTTQYHLNAGLMEEFYLWIVEHTDQIEEEEKLEKRRKHWREGVEEKTAVPPVVETTVLANGQESSNNNHQMMPHPHQVTPPRTGSSPIRCLLDTDLSDSFGHEDTDDETGREQSAEALNQRVNLLEDQNYVLTTRVSALECRNIALENQVRTMMLALKEAKLLP
jgi:hypothetical protein